MKSTVKNSKKYGTFLREKNGAKGIYSAYVLIFDDQVPPL
jgi:hypothetical protein